MKLRTAMLIAALTAPLSAALVTSCTASDLDKPIPAAASDPANGAATEVAVLAGGCVWGQQGVFQHVNGVT